MEEKEIHLRDYIRVLIKRKHTVLSVFIVVSVVSLLLTLSATPLYRASAKLLIEKSEQPNLGDSRFYLMPYDPGFLETQYQLIKSSSVAKKVVKSLSLDETYDRYVTESDRGFDPVRGTIDWIKSAVSVFLRVIGISKPQSGPGKSSDVNNEDDSRTEMLSRMISASIEVSPIKDSKLVTISFYSPNPTLAALIVNSVAQAYMDEILDMRMGTTRHAVKWLSEKAEEERVRLEDSERKLQEYMRAHDIVTLENRIAMVPEKLSEVANKIAASETKRKEMEVLHNKVKDIGGNIARAEAIPAIANDPTINALRDQIFKAEQNISELSKKYGPKHPAMIKARNELQGLHEKKKREIVRVIESIKNEYELAKENEENLRMLAKETKSDTLDLNERFIQYSVLKREVETHKQLFDSIIKRITEQDITQDVQTVNVWVVEKAEQPKLPAKPNKPRNILFGLIMGLLGGIGLAFFVDYLDNTVKTAEDFEERLGVPVLGMITLHLESQDRIEEAILKEPQSVFAESYRGIRTSIFLSRAEHPPKNILITSVSPQEGKTVTSVNLAMTIAKAEHQVLLIDGDLRKPRIHEIFGLNNDKGLSTYLAGSSDLDICQDGPMQNLKVIPSGPIPPNPSELLSSSRLRKLLSELNEKFDMIIWDSAPLLSVTDSHILSSVLDGTVVITRAGKTTYEDAGRGIKLLQEVEKHFLGVVINGIDIRKGDYGYRYYHNYYSYGEKTE